MDKEKELENELTYDSVFWTGVVKLTRFLIPLVNEAFHEHFTEKASVVLKPNKQVTKQEDGAMSQRYMDALAELTEPGKEGKVYHFECETWPDSGIAVRLAEYAAGYAFSHVKSKEGGAEIVLPHAAVIFLRPEGADLKEQTITVRYPGGAVEYPIPVLRIKDYTLEELFQKRLLLLLPFYAFHFSEEFAEMDGSLERMEELKETMREIHSRLAETGYLDTAQKGYMMGLVRRVLEKLTLSYGNIRKEMEEIMGGYIIRIPEVDDVLDEAEERGLQRGMERGMQRGLKQGMKQGMEQGMERGMQRGLQTGMQRGLQTGKIQEYVELRREDGFSDEQLLAGIMSRFHLERDEAEGYVLQGVLA